MDNNKRTKLYEMLKNMSDYSIEQPKAIEDLCSELFISPGYAPVLDLMVEAFLTVHSFVLLMFEGLVSNASAILRILIEQVAAVTVIAKNQNALSEFLRFQSFKRQYYSSQGEERETFREFLFQRAGFKGKNEKALKDYLDYGWIRVLNNAKSERGDKLIIKEARLEEMIADINEQLNAFAHGQRSMFSFAKNKDIADKHISRIIMVAGKLFLFLYNAKHELLVDASMTSDKFFELYLNAKILYLDLNARSTNSRIVEIIKNTDDFDRDAVYLMSTLDHMRGLLYQSELNPNQVNVVARAYVLDAINLMIMVSYKIFSEQIFDLLDGVMTFYDLITKIGVERIKPYYLVVDHSVELEQLFEMIDRIDDKWGLMRQNGTVSELDEAVITDFSSLVHSLFEFAYSDLNKEELLKSFVPID